MSNNSRPPGTVGVVAGLAAYIWWGLSPIYWKQLGDIPAIELTSWRVLCTVLTLAIALTLLSRRSAVRQTVSNQRTMLALVGTGLLIAVNWGVYVWAVSDGRIVESALGYFINPLVSVFLGVVFLSERLRTAQWVAVLFAVAGVIWLTIDLGQLPWVALALAFSFGFYGLIRKLVDVDPIIGLGIEATVLIIPAAIVLAIGGSSLGFGKGDGQLWWGAGNTVLLLTAGTFTAVPLVLFAFAARRVSLSVVGLLQYVNPTMQFFIGWQIYSEPFNRGQFIGYVIIWVGLVIFAIDGLGAGRRAFGDRSTEDSAESAHNPSLVGR